MALEPASPLEREVSPEQLSLVARLRQPRTIISIILPIVLLVLLFVGIPPLGIPPAIAGFRLEELPGKILGANPWLLLAAFSIFYLGFPLRGYRWATLVRRSGFRLGYRDATEIIFLSWLVNCVVPAKLGDVYRAYLLKINSPVSLSRTFGTVFIERILDLFAIVTLGLAAGFVSFRSGLPADVQIVFAIGVVVVLLLAGGLLTMRNFGRRIRRGSHPAPDPRVHDRFEEASSPDRSEAAASGVLKGLIGPEGPGSTVVQALGLEGVHLGSAGPSSSRRRVAVTAVPLTPAGIGFVNGVVGLLTVVYGVALNDALTITLIDRTISVLSIIVFGSIAYAISGKRRGTGCRRLATTLVGTNDPGRPGSCCQPPGEWSSGLGGMVSRVVRAGTRMGETGRDRVARRADAGIAARVAVGRVRVERLDGLVQAGVRGGPRIGQGLRGGGGAGGRSIGRVAGASRARPRLLRPAARGVGRSRRMRRRPRPRARRRRERGDE
jgi:uncharacterized membrane protein YbhN (UPF0104 family)